MTSPNQPVTPPTDIERKPVPGELQFILVILAMALILAITGLPGEATKVAGDGSEALELGWAAQQRAEADADAAQPLDREGPTR